MFASLSGEARRNRPGTLLSITSTLLRMMIRSSTLIDEAKRMLCTSILAAQAVAS